VGRYRKEVVEYLVQWKGYGSEWNRWIRKEDMSDDKQSMREPLIEGEYEGEEAA